MAWLDTIATGLGITQSLLGIFGGGRNQAKPSPKIATYDWERSRIAAAEQIRQLGWSQHFAEREAALRGQEAASHDARARKLTGRARRMRVMGSLERQHAQATADIARDRVVKGGALRTAQLERMTEADLADAEARNNVIEAQALEVLRRGDNQIARIGIAREQALGALDVDLAQGGVAGSSFARAQARDIAAETGRAEAEARQGKNTARKQRAAGETGLAGARERAAARMEFTRGTQELESGLAEWQRSTAYGRARLAEERTGQASDDIGYEAEKRRLAATEQRELRDVRARDADTLRIAQEIGKQGLKSHPGVEEYGGKEEFLTPPDDGDDDDDTTPPPVPPDDEDDDEDGGRGR